MAELVDVLEVLTLQLGPVVELKKSHSLSVYLANLLFAGGQLVLLLVLFEQLEQLQVKLLHVFVWLEEVENFRIVVHLEIIIPIW